MRYELDTNGYIQTVTWGCSTGNCTEYTGTTPSGYTDLNDWSENALINAYYIKDGNLTLDSDKLIELETKIEQEKIDNEPLYRKDLYGTSDVLDSQYKNAAAKGKIIAIDNVKKINPKVKITNISDNKIDVITHNKNMLENNAKTETINGVDFTKNLDGSISINGTPTETTEYNISGSDTNITPIFALKKNEEYYLSSSQKDSGESLYIKADGSDLELTIDGNSYQETRSGKNLLKNLLTNQTKNGITATVNSDKSVTFNGTATSTTLFYISKDTWGYNSQSSILEAGTYTFKNIGLAYSNARVFIDAFNESNKHIFGTVAISSSDQTFTLSEKASLNVRIEIPSGVTLNNQNICFQIEQGSVATEYEQYGVSPSPDYPSKIKIVEYANLLKTTNWSQYTITSVGGTTVSDDRMATDYIEAEPNKQYMFSCGIESNFYGIAYYDSSKTFLSRTSKNGGNSIVGTTPNDTKYIRVFGQFVMNVAFTQDKFEEYQLMLNEGSTIKPYVPYKNIGIQNVGKNLFNKDNPITLMTSSAIYSILDDGLRISIHVAGGYRYRVFDLGKSEKYNGKTIRVKCNFKASNNNAPMYTLGMCNSKGENRIALKSSSVSGSEISGIIDSSLGENIYLLLGANGNSNSQEAGVYADFTNIIVTVDNEDMTYEPYQEQLTYIDLQDNFIGKIGDVEDKLYIKDGSAYLEKNIGKVVLDGSKNITLNYNSSMFRVPVSNFKIRTSDKNVSNLIYSTHYKNEPYASMYNSLINYGIEVGDANNKYIYIRNKDITNVNDFKTWLSENNVEVYYVLETPETIDLGEVSISTFEGVNNISLLATLDTNIIGEYLGLIDVNMYDYDGTSKNQVYTGENGLITLSENKEVTQVTITLNKGEIINTTIKPMLEYGSAASEWEENKTKKLAIDLDETNVDYLYIENGIVYASKDGEQNYLAKGNVNLFDGFNTIYTMQDTNIEMTYCLNKLDGYSTTLEMNSAIKRSADEIKLEVSKKASLSDVENAIEELESSIKITTDGISTEVSKKISGDEVVSSINQSAEQITLSGNRLVVEANNFQLDANGNMVCTNAKVTGDIYLGTGSKVVGGDGLLTNLHFQTIEKYSGYSLLGFAYNYGDTFDKLDVDLDVYIPTNFKVVEAYATLYHTPVDWAAVNGATQSAVVGYCRNVKLYKCTDNNNFTMQASMGGGYYITTNELTGNLISGAFGTDGYTATNTTSPTIEVTRSSNIGASLTTGNNKLFLRTSQDTSSYGNTDEGLLYSTDACSKTGLIKMVVDVIGYMNYE